MEADKNYVQVLSVTDLEGTEKVAKPYEGLPGSYWYIPQICKTRMALLDFRNQR